LNNLITVTLRIGGESIRLLCSVCSWRLRISFERRVKRFESYPELEPETSNSSFLDVEGRLPLTASPHTAPVRRRGWTFRLGRLQYEFRKLYGDASP